MKMFLLSYHRYIEVMNRQQRRQQQKRRPAQVAQVIPAPGGRLALPKDQLQAYMFELCAVIRAEGRGQDTTPMIERLAARYGMSAAQVRDTLPPPDMLERLSGMGVALSA